MYGIKVCQEFKMYTRKKNTKIKQKIHRAQYGFKHKLLVPKGKYNTSVFRICIPHY